MRSDRERRPTASGATTDYDKLYDEQNLAPDDAQRKVLMDQLQNLFYDQAPYHILYYDDELDAYRTDVFGGWQNQPLDTGVPLFTYGVSTTRFLTDAKAVAIAVAVDRGTRSVRQRRRRPPRRPRPRRRTGTRHRRRPRRAVRRSCRSSSWSWW